MSNFYKVTTIEEDFKKIFAPQKEYEDLVEEVIQGFIAPVEESENLETGGAVEVEEDQDFDELHESEYAGIEDELSALDEVARKRVRIKRGSEKAKARRAYRRNRAKILRKQKRYRRSAAGRRAIRRRERIMKRLGLDKKRRPARIRFQFQDSGVISNLAEEAEIALESLKAPKTEDRVRTFARLAQVFQDLSNLYEAKELDSGGWNPDTLSEMAEMLAYIAEVTFQGGSEDVDLDEIYENAIQAVRNAVEVYELASKMEEAIIAASIVEAEFEREDEEGKLEG